MENNSNKESDQLSKVKNFHSEADSDYYWKSYAHFGIHEEMLKDKVRMNFYQEAIFQNKHLFKDKIVLDVGCGTGIMSLWAAKAGAKKVIAIDACDIASSASQIIKIEVRQCKIEDLELDFQVDLIISEWMGYCLVYESMFQSVMFARDKFLKSDGIMLPNFASMSICGIEDSEYRRDKIDFWDQVEGFDFSILKKAALFEPLVDSVNKQQVMTSSHRFGEFDLSVISLDKISAFSHSFSIKSYRADYCHALVVFFDVKFTKGIKPVSFSTSPYAPYTHWKQTIFYLEPPLLLAINDLIKGKISFKANAKNPRDWDISIEYSLFSFESQTSGPILKQDFLLC